MYKKSIHLLLLCFMMLMISVPSFGEEATVDLVVDGQHHIMMDEQQGKEMKAFIHNNRTMAPMRMVFDLFGLELNWNASERTITTTTADEKVVVLTIGSTVAMVDGVAIEMDAPPLISENRTFVPIKYLMDWVGVDYQWDGENRIVSIERLNASEKSALEVEGFTLDYADPNGNRTYIGVEDDSKRLSVIAQEMTWEQALANFRVGNNLSSDNLSETSLGGWTVQYFQYTSGLDIGFTNTIGVSTDGMLSYRFELMNIAEEQWQALLQEILQ